VELQGVIGTTLEYFQELENATHLLNHPGESLVLQTDFLYMVERVDICIEFLKSHVRPIYSRFPRRLSNLPSGPG
jgi:conserved oligomeric Golgi complex subunit 3